MGAARGVAGRAGGGRDRPRRRPRVRDVALRGLGITVSLAPVADVPTVTDAALGGRAFASDPRDAEAALRDAVAGWRAGGVAATVKHFPGLGGATVNTDDGPATIDRSRAQLEAVDLPPFAAAIDAGVPLVMVGHARYPALDRDRIASQSRAGDRGRAARRAALPRRGRHRLDGGRGVARHRLDHARRRSARSAPAPTCCC